MRSMMIQPVVNSMKQQDEARSIYIGDTLRKEHAQGVSGDTVEFLGEEYYRIIHYDQMDPFFLSLVSSSDHWLFLSSTGGLSAGRENAEWALFPYYTDDKITENADNTGGKAIFLVTRSGFSSLWEPFSEIHAGCYSVTRAIYKNTPGTSVVFEETNHTLGLRYRYAWRTGETFGFIKTAWLTNLGKEGCHIEVLDGFQNILPANVPSQSQNVFSNLLDAYKRSELHAETGLGIFTLSSVLSDLAEPSESLLATTAGQVGLEEADYLLSSTQLDAFRRGRGVTPERDVCGQRGAYFAHSLIYLLPDSEKTWHFFADVRQDHAAVITRIHTLKQSPESLAEAIEADIEANRQQLVSLVGMADGLQVSQEPSSTGHHFANVMFNIMRGGVFPDQYQILKSDFRDYVLRRNNALCPGLDDLLAALPERFSLPDLRARAAESSSPDLVRLSHAYLPLIFSRRHGDPSRPWNRFSIRLKNPDGSRRFGYEGNWRDIFQNWEALAFSYPEYTPHMISTFLNATTYDGYNPYRITSDGIDWERPEPDNPWANIGYWSDHQIIYLQKLLEVSERFAPESLSDWLNRPLFSYANVPYRIKPYEDLIDDPYNSIDFDWELDRKIEELVKDHGADGKLVRLPDGSVYHAGLAEKLLTLLLGKLVNFVPDGGIWMNTQRPEWNDANNALVGKGISIVTLAYLRRFVEFFEKLVSGTAEILAGAEVLNLLQSLDAVLRTHEHLLTDGFSPEMRRNLLDELGQAGSGFRNAYYREGVSGQTGRLPQSELKEFLQRVIRYIDATLHSNRRPDDLYHSYNILKLEDGSAHVETLYEMLEGQVAVLSSGFLSAEETLKLLRSLRRSALYRADQHSYILYPDRRLPGFLEKNALTDSRLESIPLANALLSIGDTRLLSRDRDGGIHFNAEFRNIRDVNQVLAELADEPEYRDLEAADADAVRRLFEETFRHDLFTGRSGTFFAYEGLGSIYWHMVSKLMLAVQECALWFRDTPEGPHLLKAYMDIRSGLGYKKGPDVYGAFPADPYSHTPKDRGAKQPGMTGLVKEEILTRLAEVGLMVSDGILHFDSWFLDRAELIREPAVYTYRSVDGEEKECVLESGSLAFSFCQVPVIVRTGKKNRVTVYFSDGEECEISGHRLDESISRHIFCRDGVVESLVVDIR